MWHLLLLGCAGACGALARYGLSTLSHWCFPQYILLSTWLVNIIGCFLLGLMWVAAREMTIFTDEIRVIFSVGFVGAFTTFSAYIFDAWILLQAGRYATLFLYLFAQNGVGLCSFILGCWLGRYFLAP